MCAFPVAEFIFGPGDRKRALQFLPEEELLVTLGVVIEGAEHLVAAPLIERPRLEGMGVELDCMAAALPGIGLGLVHELGRPTLAAHGLVDPEVGDILPPAPSLA